VADKTHSQIKKILQNKKKVLKKQTQLHISKRKDCRNLNYLLAQIYLIDEITVEMKR